VNSFAFGLIRSDYSEISRYCFSQTNALFGFERNDEKRIIFIEKT